mmetsp:Transcript_132610/g.330740  ORF Transcript_132610/g.330740 Transcript_132610/m.330740 type:complete len:245 (+) Transcript_132610:100-834(+)
MAAGCDELGSEVIGGAACCERLADDELGQAHVRQFDVSLLGEEQIFGLEVAIDDLALVAVIEGKDRASHVVPCMLLASMQALLAVGRIQLAAQCRLQQEVKMLLAVVRGVQLDDEIRAGHHQDGLLVHHGFLHPRLHDEALAQRLQGERVARLLVLNQLDGAEAAAAEEANPLQLGPVDVRLHVCSSSCSLLALQICRSRAILRLCDDVPQGPNKHVERRAIEGKDLGILRGHDHGRCPWLVVQ